MRILQRDCSFSRVCLCRCGRMVGLRRLELELTSEERSMIPWPLEIVEDPARRALEALSCEEFARFVLLESHLDEVVVLRECQAMRLTADACLPDWFPRSAKSVMEFLEQVEKHPISEKLKCSVEYVNRDGVQKEAKRARRGNMSFSQRIECARHLDLLYCCELRKRKAECRSVPHPCAKFRPCSMLGARRTKTILERQIGDAFGDLGRFALSWDNSDDGLFVGGRGAGKGLHVDQVFWSNVGVNFTGYKLLATWECGQMSTQLHSEMLDEVFGVCLTSRQLEALEKAKTVTLLRPGDVFCMSGGVAHATLTISRRDLNVTAYESFVSLNRDNVRHFLRTTGNKGGDPRYRLRSGTMPRDEFEDFKDRTIDALDAIFEHPRPVIRSDDAFVRQVVLTTVSSEDLANAAAEIVLFLVDHDPFYDKHVPRRVREAALKMVRGNRKRRR